jgi:hypothetical protein
MAKILFVPISLIGGLLAGFISKKIFDQVWGLIDEEEPPEAEHSEAPLWKLTAAMALQGAIFRAMRGVADHEARRGFQRITGTWPGEARPEPE